VRSSDPFLIKASEKHVNGVSHSVVPSTSSTVYSTNETVVRLIVRFVVAFVAVQAMNVGHGRFVGGCAVVCDARHDTAEERRKSSKDFVGP
jgi:hypothetical protein